jgi:hypothetical protein
MSKNPWIAAGLSFIVAGLGQVYIGEIWKGLGFFCLEFISGYWFINEGGDAAGLINFAVSVIAMIDAYYGAKRIMLKKPPEPEQKTEEPVVRVY